MGKPSAPTPPDPRTTAAASESTNVGTGIANAFMNNVNQVTPYGSLNYNQSGNYNYTDPYTGQTYNIPQFTATQTLSPQGQAIQDQSFGTQLNLATLGNQQSGKLGQILGAPLDLSGAPAAGNINQVIGNSAQDRANVEQSLFDRINPQLQRQQSQLEQQLADKGIKYGSPAYTAAMDNYNRAVTDTRLGITAQGGQEQQLQQNIGLQQFGAQNTLRDQYLTEAYQNRQEPINEITALLSGSQVKSPSFVNTPQYGIANTDVGGLINQNFAQQEQNYQTGMSSWNSMMGGILGLGGSLGGAAIKSDRRSKDNIRLLAFAGPLPIYSYSYKSDPFAIIHSGPMAQDVERIDPSAVTEIGGMKYIILARLDEMLEAA